jgi:hypothetical protein
MFHFTNRHFSQFDEKEIGFSSCDQDSVYYEDIGSCFRGKSPRFYQDELRKPHKHHLKFSFRTHFCYQSCGM